MGVILMSETTIIPPAGTNGTPGFHSVEGGHHHDNHLVGILLSQHAANEGRSNQKTVFDATLSNRDCVERGFIATRTDNERLHARIDDTRFENLRQMDIIRAEFAKEISGTKELMLRLHEDNLKERLAVANAEIQLLKLKSSVIA